METIELIKRSRAGDKLAREQVIKANMPLVYSIVKRFVGRGYDAEDLSQIGAIGLIKAVDNFNVNFEVKFSTYAVPVISGEIKRFLRDDGKRIKSFLIFGLRYDKVVNSSKFYLYHDRLDHRYSQ